MRITLLMIGKILSALYYVEEFLVRIEDELIARMRKKGKMIE